jgi:multiple sugar transport system substrate-binding protein
MRRFALIILAAMLVMVPLGSWAADLVVWWDKGANPEEDAAVKEIIAAFERETGKEVELVLHPLDKHPEDIVAALEVGQPPDLAFGFLLLNYSGQWAFDDRLVELSEAIGHFSDLFDPDVLSAATWPNASTGQRALYGLPMGRTATHVHVWKSLLERAGFTLADIPKDWGAFWAFWCDEVQPAVRRATGRADIWGVGLAMSPTGGVDLQNVFFPFLAAYQADYVTRDGRLVIDDPEIRRKLVEVIDSYAAIYRKGCTPPDSVTWDTFGNNKAFLAQTVVMTINQTLSIPNALKRERPEDYYENTATIEWPLGLTGEPFSIIGGVQVAVVFKDGGHVATAKELVRFLVSEGWLMHYLDFSAERMLPPMQKLLDQPFWLDPSDRHRMAAVMQVSSRPLHYDYSVASGNWRYDRVWQEVPWAKAIHRVAAEGISPEQAVDEAIARIKQILNE